MTFYYNGKKVRTSKNHHYSHAVITENGKALTCSATKKGCETFINSCINENLRGIENAKRAINAVNAGRTRYEVRSGRRSYFEPIQHDAEHYQRWINSNNKHIEHIKANWKIVELEERE